MSIACQSSDRLLIRRSTNSLSYVVPRVNVAGPDAAIPGIGPMSITVNMSGCGGGGITSVTVCGPLAIPSLLMETDTVPALTLVTANDRVVPVPVKAPLVAEPLAEASVMSDATSPVGSALKVKLIAVVVGSP